MLEVKFTSSGERDFRVLPTVAKIDIIHKLELVERLGLGGELKIGEIAPTIAIFLLYAGNHHIAVAQDDQVSPASCHVVAIEVRLPIDVARKAAFVTVAARDVGRATRIVVI